MKSLLTIMAALVLAGGASAGQAGGGGGGGAGGAGGAGGGGAGGAGGSGRQITLPTPTQAHIDRVMARLTPEQRKQLAELQEAQAGTKHSYKIMDMAALLAEMPDAEFAQFAQSLPESIERAQRENNPFWVSAAEKADAAKLNVPTKDLDGLLADNLDDFLAARQRMLGYPPACRALVAAQGAKVPANSDKSRRLLKLMDEIGELTGTGKRIRVIETALKRAKELAASRTDKPKIVALVSRGVVNDNSVSRTDPYRHYCYFSFITETYDYGRIPVSLMFDNGRGTLDGMRDNFIKDMGAVELASLKTAPNSNTTEQWEDSVEPIAGHCYIEHCVEKRHNVDQCFKFKVLEVKPREWVIIEYASIEQEK